MMRLRAFQAVIFVACLVVLIARPTVVNAKTWTVTDSGDDGNLQGTLRWTLNQLIASGNDGDSIEFNLPQGQRYIRLSSDLPPILKNYITVNGYSSPGSSMNTLPVGNNAIINVIISGQGIANNGLWVIGAGANISGISIVNCKSSAILTQGTNFHFWGNAIGIHPDQPDGWLGPNCAGIEIAGDSSNGVIGGPEPKHRNTISGNKGPATCGGLYTYAANIAGKLLIDGNYIGTNLQGETPLGNDNGIILWGASDVIIGKDVGNVISGNLISGIYSQISTSISIDGNLIGTNAAGNALLSNKVGIKSVQGKNQSIGATKSNVISGNTETGLELQNWISGVVDGNLIGTDSAGTKKLGNGTGLYISQPLAAMVVGGAKGNIVSGNIGNGIFIKDSQSSVTFVHNIIGSNADGIATLGNGSAGMRIAGTTISVSIGDKADAKSGNTISFNSGPGVTAADWASDLNLWYNSIHSNAGLGFDLSADGVTLNDAGDPNKFEPGDLDAGPNGLLNYPSLTSATSDPSSLTIEGTYDGPALGIVAPTIHFYGNDECDNSGYGEGKRFIGSLAIQPDGALGDAVFKVVFPDPGDSFITALITYPASMGVGTSEFSKCVKTYFVPQILFAENAATVAEDGGTLDVEILRRGDLAVAASALLKTTAGTATEGDFTALSQRVEFGPNEGAKKIKVAIVDDNNTEPNESFTLQLSEPSNGVKIGLTNLMTVTITDNDKAPPPPPPDNDEKADEPEDNAKQPLLPDPTTNPSSGGGCSLIIR